MYPVKCLLFIINDDHPNVADRFELPIKDLSYQTLLNEYYCNFFEMNTNGTTCTR